MSHSGIRAALEGRKERIDALAKLTGDNGVTWAPRAADGCRMGDWTIRFTGRTQRDATMNGELPYIEDL